MAKVIEIQKGGYIWHVDLHAVADHRAKYYAAKDPDTTHKAEYDFVMGDDFEGIDWYQNNMNWSDVPAENKRLFERPTEPEGPDDHELSGDEAELDILDVVQQHSTEAAP